MHTHAEFQTAPPAPRHILRHPSTWVFCCLAAHDARKETKYTQNNKSQRREHQAFKVLLQRKVSHLVQLLHKAATRAFVSCIGSWIKRRNTLAFESAFAQNSFTVVPEPWKPCVEGFIPTLMKLNWTDLKKEVLQAAFRCEWQLSNSQKRASWIKNIGRKYSNLCPI